MSVRKRLVVSSADRSGPTTNLQNKQLPPEHIAGSKAHASIAYINQELKDIISKLKAAGKYGLLRKFLSQRELQVMELRIDRDPPASHAEVAELLGIHESNSCSFQNSIMKKARIVLEADDGISSMSSLKKLNRKSINKILDAVDALLAQGKTIDEITAEFNKTEKRVFDTYVMADPPIYITAAAELLSLSVASVTKALASMVDFLTGKGRNNRYKAKYEKMSEEELAAAILALNCKDRSELYLRNDFLASVANSQGILDGILPKRQGKTITKIKNAYYELLNTNTQDQIFSLLKQMEINFLKEVVLSSPPVSDNAFIEKYPAISLHGLYNLKKKLLAKLKGEPVTSQENLKVFHQLKVICAYLGAERLGKLKTNMSPLEVYIMEKRIIAEEPMSLHTIGELFNITRECVRQTEKELLEKLCQISSLPEFHLFPKKKFCGSMVREIREMLLICYKNGRTNNPIYEMLDIRQKQALEIYVLSSKSLSESASEIGIRPHTLYLRTLAIQTKLTCYLMDSGLQTVLENTS